MYTSKIFVIYISIHSLPIFSARYFRSPFSLLYH